jgi:hypothetical protein
MAKNLLGAKKPVTIDCLKMKKGIAHSKKAMSVHYWPKLRGDIVDPSDLACQTRISECLHLLDLFVTFDEREIIQHRHKFAFVSRKKNSQNEEKSVNIFT